MYIRRDLNSVSAATVHGVAELDITERLTHTHTHKQCFMFETM